MWWHSFKTVSACSLEMAVILATSRLTFWTSSSESCWSSSALACSPNTTSSMAAFFRPDTDSSALVVLRIMVRVPGASLLFLADPGAQDLGRNIRLLGDPLAQVLGHHLGLLGDYRRQFEIAQHLRIALLLQCVALRQLCLQFVLGMGRRQGRARRRSIARRQLRQGNGRNRLLPPAAQQRGQQEANY